MDTPGPVLFDDVTRPCRDITLKPFQQTIVDMAKVYSKRQVDVIYDRNGNIGKSVITNYLYTFHGAMTLPCFNNQKDVLQAASSACYRGKTKEHIPCFIFDLPRSLFKKGLGEFFAAIEQIKNGMMMDTRYKFRITNIDPPRIIIFTNIIFNENYLSKRYD